MSDAPATPGDRPRYSIVIPVYRSAAILPDLITRLEAFFAEHPSPHEIILVNDGSPDDSWRVLRELCAAHPNLVIIDLMRNFGQHSAVFCGLEVSRGQWVVTMDDDLQNPPEELGNLFLKAEEGHDAVFGRFHQKQHGLFRKLGTRVVGWLNRRLFRKPPDLVLTNFRIIRREVVDAMVAHRTTQPYIPGLLLMTGKSFANVPVEHHPRPVGRSNYGVVAIARLVWRIVFNYSAFPLRFLTGVGLALSIGSLGMAGYVLLHAFLEGSSVPGWTTLTVMLSFYQGVTLLILGALGEYVVRIVQDVSGRRAYTIRTQEESEARAG